MFPKAQEIGFVLRTPAIEIELILFEDCLAQCLGLLELRPAVNRHPAPPFRVRCRLHCCAVHLQLVEARAQALDLDLARRRYGWETMSSFVAKRRIDQPVIQRAESRIVAAAFELGNSCSTTLADLPVSPDDYSPEILAPTQTALDCLCRPQVAEARKMDAVVCQWWEPGSFGVRAKQIIKRNKIALPLFRNFPQGLGVLLQLLVVFRRVGQRGAQRF